ncbi:alpha/beta hydrolase [Larkinella terrae]|uniref:Esterase family protein n=1 Tax=Larkinella terrae TaxID=2025311 RepID=A0A7K0ELC5_9BACT|nr:alpha/beta hydrolase-fold protein [Larkinella terrae]MRS62609.1 esterase family protein [Larkinella terrae]
MSAFITSSSFADGVTTRTDIGLVSIHLNRSVRLDLIFPNEYDTSTGRFPVLYLNDGQDLERLRMTQVLDCLYQQKAIRPFVLVAIHCGDRIQEYGVAAQADYLHRGAKAGSYTEFVIHELLPYVQKHYRVVSDPEQSVFAGFSLGGLSAFDLVWNHPELFRKAGVFSGSFWWRQRGLNDGYSDDTDRIIHAQVQKTKPPRGSKFWFQTGTLDETDDRDHDGVIDSIDDTLDLIAEIERKGFRWGKEVRYVEVMGGFHNPETWSAVMPQFLVWAFGSKKE